MLSSQIAGRVVEFPYREGDAFKKNDLLVAFDCALYQAELAAARAEALARRKTFENNKNLSRLNAASALEVEVSEAEYAKAASRVRASDVLVQRCTVRAPFDGRVDATRVNRYESVAANQELLSIVDHRSLEIELIVPSHWLTWLEESVPLEFAIDETGRTYAATVSSIPARADAVSQTVRVRASFTDDVDGVIPGMSGTARFTVPR